MANKVILVIIDGLAYEVAHTCMGFLQALVEQDKATLYRLECELPSLSRPLYECILTGSPPVNSGIVSNDTTRLSNQKSIFSLARAAGLTTAAAAFHWFSELYNRTPYNPIQDRYTCDEEQNIQYGIFYSNDSYPDDHLFLDAEHLRQQYNPDFLLIHPMNTDDAGHRHGLDSSVYRNSARRVDNIIAHYLPTWMAAGYQIIITSDHGMNNDKSHGGILQSEREVPLYTLGAAFSHKHTAFNTTHICGTTCQLLGIRDHNKPWAKELLT